MYPKKTFYVTCVTECLDCNGQGYLHNPIWTDYYTWEKTLIERSGITKDPLLYETFRDEIHQWWTDHGYPMDDWSELPPEEFQCDSCGGEGKTVDNVSLADALYELGFELPE